MWRCVSLLVLSFGCFTSTLWPYSGGTGEPNDPYQIATAEDLIALGNEPNDYNDCFILTADIDFSGYTFDRAVIAADINEAADFQGNPFDGTLDGQGYVISHLAINGGSYLGLFGICGVGAAISNLALDVVDANGTTFNSIGGLVGVNYGTISFSYSVGLVTGMRDLGGLVGNNKGTIISSYSGGTINGRFEVGGLVGDNDGIITSCYSVGTVSGDLYVGGLVGGTYMGGITSCFWDIETSGQTSSKGGTGLTSAQMQDINTFLNAGWDFVDETDNGTDDLWWMPVSDTPRLWWELSE